jgi:hypothetical protein
MFWWQKIVSLQKRVREKSAPCSGENMAHFITSKVYIPGFCGFPSRCVNRKGINREHTENGSRLKPVESNWKVANARAFTQREGKPDNLGHHTSTCQILHYVQDDTFNEPEPLHVHPLSNLLASSLNR